MNVAIIRFGSFGDCVLLCPLASHLKANGATSVTIITKSAYLELFAVTAGVDKVVTLAPGAGIRGLRSIARNIRTDGLVVIDAHNNLRSRTLCRMLGGHGSRFDKRYRDRLNLIVFKKRTQLPTILQQYGRLASAINASTDELVPGGVAPAASAREKAIALLHGAENLIAFAPGTRWPTKQWPTNNFTAAAESVVARPGDNVVLLGDKNDVDTAAGIQSKLGDACINLTGQTSIMETAAVLERCRALVGNDSGLMHLSEAVNTPVVGIFGPTVREFGYFPALPLSRIVERKLDCRPCSRNGALPCPKRTQECLTEIKVETVIDALRSITDTTVEANT